MSDQRAGLAAQRFVALLDQLSVPAAPFQRFASLFPHALGSSAQLLLPEDLDAAALRLGGRGTVSRVRGLLAAWGAPDAELRRLHATVEHLGAAVLSLTVSVDAYGQRTATWAAHHPGPLDRHLAILSYEKDALLCLEPVKTLAAALGPVISHARRATGPRRATRLTFAPALSALTDLIAALLPGADTGALLPLLSPQPDAVPHFSLEIADDRIVAIELSVNGVGPLLAAVSSAQADDTLRRTLGAGPSGGVFRMAPGAPMQVWARYPLLATPLSTSPPPSSIQETDTVGCDLTLNDRATTPLSVRTTHIDENRVIAIGLACGEEDWLLDVTVTQSGTLSRLLLRLVAPDNTEYVATHTAMAWPIGGRFQITLSRCALVSAGGSVALSGRLSWPDDGIAPEAGTLRVAVPAQTHTTEAVLSPLGNDRSLSAILAAQEGGSRVLSVVLRGEQAVVSLHTIRPQDGMPHITAYEGTLPVEEVVLGRRRVSAAGTLSSGTASLPIEIVFTAD